MSKSQWDVLVVYSWGWHGQRACCLSPSKPAVGAGGGVHRRPKPRPRAVDPAVPHKRGEWGSAPWAQPQPDSRPPDTRPARAPPQPAPEASPALTPREHNPSFLLNWEYLRFHTMPHWTFPEIISWAANSWASFEMHFPSVLLSLPPFASPVAQKLLWFTGRPASFWAGFPGRAWFERLWVFNLRGSHEPPRRRSLVSPRKPSWPALQPPGQHPGDVSVGKNHPIPSWTL